MSEHAILIIGPILASVVTWLFTRRRMTAEASSKELDNTSKIIQMWREMSEGMELRFKIDIEDLKYENTKLQVQICDVVKENEKLLIKMHTLEEENKKLISQLKIFNKKIGKDE